MNKIKLLVVNENVLGYVFPEQPEKLHILQASILKGANYHDLGGGIYLNASNIKSLRLASKKDFDEFRVYFGAYNNSEIYEFMEVEK